MHINTSFKLGDMVTLMCGDDDARGMIVVIHASISGSVNYTITWGDRTDSTHSDRELSLYATAENDSVLGQ